DRADAAVLREQRVAAVAEQVEEERLVGLLLAVAVDDDGDGLRRLAGGEGQRAALGDVVVVAGRGGAVHGAELHRYRLIVGDRERDRQYEQRRLFAVAFLLRHVPDADSRLVLDDGDDRLAVADPGALGAAEVDEERLVRLARAVAVDRQGDRLRRL